MSMVSSRSMIDGVVRGDEAIIRAAEILRKTFRKSDIIARIGGDEFAIATMENGHASVVSQISRLRRNLKRHAIQNNYEKPLSLSVGVAVSNYRRTTSIEELTSQADALMYIEKRAKHQGASVRSSGDYKSLKRAPMPNTTRDETKSQVPMANVS